MTVQSFGARLHESMRTRGRLCVGIDPHAALLAQWGLADDVAGLERFALTAVEAIAPVAGVVKPQSAFFERFGSRGIAVLERVIAESRAGRRAGPAGREAGRHRLHHPGLRRCLPRPRLDPGGGRDHRQPVPRLRVPGADGGDRPSARCGTLRAGPHLQPRGVAGAVRGVRRPQRGGHRPGPAARAQPRRGADGRLRSRWWARPWPRSRRTSTSTARSWLPGSARRAGRSPTCGGSSARAAPSVLPSSSREVLSAGPDTGALRDAVLRGNEAVAGPGGVSPAGSGWWTSPALSPPSIAARGAS